MSLPLQHLTVLARNDGEEALEGAVPLSELTFRPRAPGVMSVLLNDPAQQLTLAELRHVNEIDQPLVALALQLAELIEHECNSAAHPRAEVSPDASEHDDGPTCHVLAAVIADSFHDRDRTAVTHGEALSSNSSEVRLPRRRAIEHGVANENRLVRNELRGTRMPDDKASSRKSLADVVVRLALQLERQTTRGERAEALSR